MLSQAIAIYGTQRQQWGNDSVFYGARANTIVATPEHGIGVLAAAADKVDSPTVLTPRRQADGALGATHTVLPATPTADPLCASQHGPHDLLGYLVKEHQLGLPVPAGGAAAAEALLTNNEHQGH